MNELKVFPGIMQTTYQKKSLFAKIKENMYVWWMSRKQPIRPFSIWKLKTGSGHHTQILRVSQTHVEYFYFLVTHSITVVETKYKFYRAYKRVEWEA